MCKCLVNIKCADRVHMLVIVHSVGMYGMFIVRFLNREYRCLEFSHCVRCGMGRQVMMGVRCWVAPGCTLRNCCCNTNSPVVPPPIYDVSRLLMRPTTVVSSANLRMRLDGWTAVDWAHSLGEHPMPDVLTALSVSGRWQNRVQAVEDTVAWSVEWLQPGSGRC